MTRSQKRIAFLVLLAIPAIAGSLILKKRVAANYRHVQELLRQQNLEQARLQQVQQEAQRRADRLVRLRADVDRNPSDVRARWLLADSYQKSGMIPQAADQIAAIVKLDPSSREARVAKANIDLAQGKLVEAERDYAYCTAHWPKDVESWQGLAAARYHQRRYREAAEAADKSMHLQPEDFFTRYVFATSVLEYSAQFPTADNHSDAVMAARRLFQRMTKEDPSNSDLWYKLGRTNFMILDKEGAVSAMRKAHELSPKRQDIALDLATTLAASGDRASARQVVESSLALFPKNPGLHYTLSDLLQSSADPDARQHALDEARKAVDIAPKEPLFLERLGAAYLALGNLEEARKAYEASLKIDANRARPYQQLAAIYTRLGDTRRGSIAAKMGTRMVYNDQTLRQVQELSAKYGDAVPLKLILADRYRDLKMIGAARDTYLEVLKLDPANARAKEGLAVIAKQSQIARVPSP